MSAAANDQSPRIEQFAVSGPAELELHVGAGSVRVDLVEDASTVQVSVALGQGNRWQQGLSGVLAALGTNQPDAPGTGPGADALAATQVSGSSERNRVVVRSPQTGAARTVALDVTVVAPLGSRLVARSGSAGVEVSGTAGSVDVSTGSGDVTVADVERDVDLRTGSGDVRTGHLHQGGRARTGSGDLTVDAAAGSLDLVTGSGDLRIGIAPGVLAELDVRSGSGSARSDLPLVEPAADGVETDAGGEAGGGTASRTLVRARTGSGDALVHGAR